MLLVVDASAVLEALKGSRPGERLLGRLMDPRVTPQAPHVIDLEVAQTLRRWNRAANLPDAVATEWLAAFLEMPLRRHSARELLPRIWALRGSLTAYDAAYVALAEALDAPLVTADARIAGAAGHRARVEVL